jgi:hypothetical protein
MLTCGDPRYRRIRGRVHGPGWASSAAILAVSRCPPIGLQLLDLTSWTFGEHPDRAHTDHDLAGSVDDVATSIQPPARLMLIS